MDDILDELEDSEVNATIMIETLNVPIINAGRVGRDDLKIQTYSHNYITSKDYT